MKTYIKRGWKSNTI